MVDLLANLEVNLQGEDQKFSENGLIEWCKSKLFLPIENNNLLHELHTTKTSHD